MWADFNDPASYRSRLGVQGLIVAHLIQVRTNNDGCYIDRIKQVLLGFPTWSSRGFIESLGPCNLFEMGINSFNAGTAALPNEENSDEFEVLQNILTFNLKFMKHTNRFRLLHESPPFNAILFFQQDTALDRKWAQEAMMKMKEEWTFVLEEEAKQAQWLAQCKHLRWQAYREVMTACEESGWDASSAHVRKVMQPWVPSRGNTVSVEHTFGRLRDAESRHSKHKKAAPAQVCSVCIKTTNQLFGNTLDTTQPPLAAISQIGAQFSSGFLRKDVLCASRTTLSETGLKHPGEMLKNAEKRTSAFHFVQNGLSCLQARKLAAEKKWKNTSYLWVSSVIPEGAVV